MKDTEHLIDLVLEIEGLLRTLAVREPEGACQLVLDKIDQLSVEAYKELSARAEAPVSVVVEAKKAEPTTPGLLQAVNASDMALFATALFDGDKEKLEYVVSKIETMDTLNSVYDYLLNDLSLDPDHETAKDFLNLVAHYFNNCR